ncbi:hypothetical protein ACWEVD_00545 [Nocardia thailandica]
MAEATRKQIHPDIAVTDAYQVGRRIYVPCHYESRLGTELREQAGANWDREVKMLWVGSTAEKKTLVAGLVAAAVERKNRVAAIRKSPLAVQIPFERADLRERVKARKDEGIIYDGETRCWYFDPVLEHFFTEIWDEVNAYLREKRVAAEREKAARAEADRAARRAAREAEAAAAAKRLEERTARVVAESGRTATGKTAQLTHVHTDYMNRADAQARALSIGTLVTLSDGCRGLVVDVEVWFSDSEMASSTCWHPETHDTAHWDVRHTVALVEPTEQELAADAEAAAIAADAAALHRLHSEAVGMRLDATSESGQGWPADLDLVAEIRQRYGLPTIHDGGKVVATRDGRVLLHPGWHDDYIATHQVLTDPDYLERFHAAIAAGPRTRSIVDQMSYDYTVVIDGS